MGNNFKRRMEKIEKQSGMNKDELGGWIAHPLKDGEYEYKGKNYSFLSELPPGICFIMSPKLPKPLKKGTDEEY